MKKIRMTGITQKGKNRIREHGFWWDVIREADRVHFDKAEGPWAFVTPTGFGREHNGSRWVNLRKDKDFKIEFIRVINNTSAVQSFR